MSGSVLVIAEHREGVLRPASLEILTAARRLADQLGTTVDAAVLGPSVDDIAQDLRRVSGVDRVLTAEHAALDPFLAGPWVSAVTQVAEHVQPRVVLVPSSITGRDYAARVAARLGLPMVADVQSMSVDSEGQIETTRNVYGSKVQTTVTVTGERAAVFTVAPGLAPKAVVGSSMAELTSVAVDIAESDQSVRLLDTWSHTGGPKGITEASIIVSGGRGLGKPENFSVVETLATELGASVGASGATVGAGWRSHADQVGSTGHVVSPRLYLAVGISGAPQHLVGIVGAETVVAINRDPVAPIFDRADFGIVGDLFDVVPAVIKALQTPAD